MINKNTKARQRGPGSFLFPSSFPENIRISFWLDKNHPPGYKQAGMKSDATTQKRGPRRGGKGQSGAVRIEVVRTAQEKKRFDQLLGKHHYLGEGRSVGDYLRQVAVREGEWVGLLAWGSACYALKPRDERIGWTATLRAERQKLVVQNRRFLLLSERGGEPNLASRILGASVRALPGQWTEAFGYEPLAAETFTDIESFEGTCYKASGWEPVGQSRGYSRHRADFYVPNERPKKLWMKPLRADGYEQLRGPRLPAECLKGASSSAHGVLPLKSQQVDSLHEALRNVPDPRGRNWSFPCGQVLCIVVMALLSGHRDISAIHRFGQRLTQKQRRELGLPFKKNTRFHKVPGYKVYYNLLKKLDLEALAEVLSDWLRRQAGTLPGALALDGKMVRDTIGVLSLVDAETGVPQAMIPISMKEGEGEHCELKAAQRLIEKEPDLSGQIITADALHGQDRTAQLICERGGDYLIQVKDNRQKLRAHLQQRTDPLSPLLTTAKKGTDGSNDESS